MTEFNPVTQFRPVKLKIRRLALYALAGGHWLMYRDTYSDQDVLDVWPTALWRDDWLVVCADDCPLARELHASPDTPTNDRVGA